MKKCVQISLFIAVMGMLLLSTTGCSFFADPMGNTNVSATQDPNATVPPQQVVDAEYVLYDENTHFSIQYHSKWMIKSNLSDDGTINLDKSTVTFTIPEGMVQNQDTAARVYPTLSVFLFPIPEEEVEAFDFLIYVKNQVSYLESNLYQFTMLQDNIETIQIGGKTAYTISYVGSVLNTNEVRTKQVFLTDGEQVYVITFAANAEYYNDENYKAIADKMIASFTLKKK